ncbi:MAG: hypothetical protein JXR37_37815 [Kiritimatiellae bacterium]|nr:hypothetical protein [Kiritimatiellia bacterium]
MTRQQLKEYLEVERAQIRNYARIRSARSGQPVDRNAAAVAWIERFAAGFRQAWDRTH